MITVQLSVMERLLMPMLLPKKGGIIDMEVIAAIREEIKFTPAEIDDYEMKDQENGSVTWSVWKAKSKSFVFEPSQIKLLKTGIELNDAAGNITLETLPLAKKIQSL